MGGNKRYTKLRIILNLLGSLLLPSNIIPEEIPNNDKIANTMGMGRIKFAVAGTKRAIVLDIERSSM